MRDYRIMGSPQRQGRGAAKKPRECDSHVPEDNFQNGFTRRSRSLNIILLCFFKKTGPEKSSRSCPGKDQVSLRIIIPEDQRAFIDIEPRGLLQEGERDIFDIRCLP